MINFADDIYIDGHRLSESGVVLNQEIEIVLNGVKKDDLPTDYADYTDL